LPSLEAKPLIEPPALRSGWAEDKALVGVQSTDDGGGQPGPAQESGSSARSTAEAQNDVDLCDKRTVASSEWGGVDVGRDFESRLRVELRDRSQAEVQHLNATADALPPIQELSDADK